MAAEFTVGIRIAGDGGPDSVGAVADLAGRLEDAGVTYWVLGADRGERPPADGERLDPTVLATVAARHTAELGLVIAAAPHRDHPYNLARRLVSADRAAHGRVGWLALDDDRVIGLNAATDTWTGADLGPGHTAEAVRAVRALVHTWPADSIVADRETGTFADPSRIVRADVTGDYAIAGPLNVPASVQGDLPVWRHVDDPPVAAGWADLVIVPEGAPIGVGERTVQSLRGPALTVTHLERAAATPGVTGVLLEVAAGELSAVLDGLLPAATHRRTIRVGGGSTLRRRLGLIDAIGPEPGGVPAFPVGELAGVRP